MSKTTSQQQQLERQTIGVQFLQDLIEHTQLALKVSSLDEQTYRSLLYDESQMLSWLNYYPLYRFNERAFHLGLQQTEDGMFMIGIYDSRVGKLHILVLDPLTEEAREALPERLMAIVTYVGIYFLTTYPDSLGVYLVDPPEEFLHKSDLYGYRILSNGHDISGISVIYANFETLFERQQDFLFEMLLDKEVNLDMGLKDESTEQ